MSRTRVTRAELALAVVIPLGVLLAGLYDWADGQDPVSPLGLPSGVRLALFVFSIVLVVAAGAYAASVEAPPGRWYMVVAGLATVPIVVADPTYASLLYVMPIIDIRRRRPEPERSIATLLLIVIAALLVATERTPRASAEIEAMIGLAIVMVMAVLLGDAFRVLDRARERDAAKARVAEREHLAAEFHDSVAHHLLASSVQIKAAQAFFERDPDRAASSLDLAGRSVADALVDVRFAVDRLRDDARPFSLRRSLEELVSRMAPAIADIDLDIGEELQSLDQMSQITLYRFSQEALTNIARHANASSVSIRGRLVDHEVVVDIVDDGGGFDVDAVSHNGGLGNMRERLGRIGGGLIVSSNPGDGTHLSAAVPFRP